MEQPVTNMAAANIGALRLALELAQAQLSTLALAGNTATLPRNEEGRAVIPPPPPGSALHALYVMLRSVVESLQHVVSAQGECSIVWVFESPDSFMVASSGAISIKGSEYAATETKRLLSSVIEQLGVSPETFKGH